MEIATWSHLPIEVIEKILLEVPSQYLPYNQLWVCQIWTKLLFDPKFWLRKLWKLNIRLKEHVQSVLNMQERHIQVACLFYACINEENFELVRRMAPSTEQCEILETWCPYSITDNFKEMMKMVGYLITRTMTSIELHFEKKSIPALPILLNLLAVRETRVKMYDSYGYINFTPRYDYIKLLMGPNEKANISHLKGCVTSLHGLIGPIKGLKLSIAVDEKNIGIDPNISSTGNKLSVINIKAGTDLSRLTNLKEDCAKITGILISDLQSSQISWLVSTIKNIGSESYSYRLVFPNFTLSRMSSEILLRSIAEEGIEPLNINCASSALTEDEISLLKKIASELFTDDFDEFNFYESDKALLDNTWI